MRAMSRDSGSAITLTSATLAGSAPDSESNTQPQARPVPLHKSRRATYSDVTPQVGLSGSVPSPPHRVETDQDEAPGQRQSHGQAQGRRTGCEPESGLDTSRRRDPQSAGIGTSAGAGEVKQNEEGFVHGYRDVPSLAAIRERVRERGMSVSTVAAPAPAASTAVAAAASMSISSSASSISGPAAVAGPGNLAADAETHRRKPLENDAPLFKQRYSTRCTQPGRKWHVHHRRWGSEG
jgi:hypothetical protein